VSTYKIDYSQNAQNTSAIATIQSDVSSSTSLENRMSQEKADDSQQNDNTDTSTTNNRCLSTLPSASYTMITQKPPLKQQSMTSSPSQTVSSATSKPQTLIYSGSNNMYMKAYQQQQQQQHLHQGSHSNIMSKNPPIASHQSNIHNHSPESGYSTPVSNILNKKLVYEVIV
jgi:hypothetical protein